MDSTDKLTELLAQLDEAKLVLEPLNNEVAKLNSEEYQLKQAFNEALVKIQAQKRNHQLKLNEANQSVVLVTNKIQMEKAAIEAAEAAAKKAAADKERLDREAAMYDTLGKRFEQASMGAPWREFAKDYQMTAGKKIAIDQKVILADSMGLGKTLSSIITADMTEKASRDVSPEFPMLGKEVAVWQPSRKVWTQKAIDAYVNHEWPFNVDSSMRSLIHETPSITPFGDPIRTYGADKFEAGATVPYFPYDQLNNLLSNSMVEVIDAKTVTEIQDAITRPVGRKILYFCPAPLLRNVLEEWRRWSPGRSVTYIGAMSKKEREFALSFLPKLDEYVIIVNYEAWRRDGALIDELIACKFDTVIIDEAHNIKDTKSQGYRGVKRVLDETEPEYVIPMTGTPILNRPQELFSLLTLVNPKEFYREKDFLWSYCEEYYVDDSTTPKYKFKSGGLDALSKKISKNYMRRTKEQVGLNLPEKVIITHDIERDDSAYPEQAKAREHMKKFATIVVNKQEGKAISATVMIALITRLRQIETWPAGIKSKTTYTDENGIERDEFVQLQVEESQKIDYTIRYDKETNEWEGLIPDSIEDERMVVFSQFKAPLHELKRRIELMGKSCVIIDGDTPPAIREEARMDFDRRHCPDRANAKWDVALCNYKAAGVGLNLTAATNMVILDQEWNPGKRDQAYDRLHRIGQTENVTINVLNTTNTIDQWLEDIMKDKENLVNGFEGAMIKTSDLMNAIESGLI
jgi:SNF2 family DNA or RNA helicase